MRKQYQQGKIHFFLTGLIVIAGLAGWQLYQMRYDLNVANQKVESLNLQLTELYATVEALQRDVQRLDNSSLKGVVREANNAILTGWEALIHTVEGELRKAREDLEQGSTVHSTINSPATSTPAASPDANLQSQSPALEIPVVDDASQQDAADE